MRWTGPWTTGATPAPGSRTTRVAGSSSCATRSSTSTRSATRDDVWFDDYGNLVWVVRDPYDHVPPEHQRIIYFDGHTDTVQALRAQWHDKLGGAVDPYDGLVDAGVRLPLRCAPNSATSRPTTSGSTSCSAAARPTSWPVWSPRSSPRRSCWSCVDDRRAARGDRAVVRDGRRGGQRRRRPAPRHGRRAAGRRCRPDPRRGRAH